MGSEYNVRSQVVKDGLPQFGTRKFTALQVGGETTMHEVPVPLKMNGAAFAERGYDVRNEGNSVDPKKALANAAGWLAVNNSSQSRLPVLDSVGPNGGPIAPKVPNSGIILN